MALCVAVSVLVGPAAAMMGQEAPQDCPQWRGHHRDGAASAFSKPASWPEHLRLRWRVDVGAGYATPIVVGHTVYAFTRRDGVQAQGRPQFFIVTAPAASQPEGNGTSRGGTLPR